MKALRLIFAVAFVVLVMATALLAASPAGAAPRCGHPKAAPCQSNSWSTIALKEN